MRKTKNRPMFLEYRKPHGRERKNCCYKDDPCPIHKKVLQQLVGIATGEIKADQNKLLK